MYYKMQQQPLSGFWDTVKQIGSSTWGVVSSAEQAKGAQTALQAQLAQQQIAAGGGGTILGFQPMTLFLLGGVGVGAYFLLRKKKQP